MIRSGGFRIPNIGEMENTDIDEIIRRYKPVSSTKTKTPKKTKPVAKAKAKTKNPRVKTKRRSPVGRRINMRGGPLGLEDLINDEQTIGQVSDSVRERFKPPAFDRSKLEEAIANARKAKKKFTPFQNVDYTPEYTPEQLELGRRLNTIPSFTIESARRIAEENQGYRNLNENTLGPKVDRPPQSREEILKSISGMLGGSGSSGPRGLFGLIGGNQRRLPDQESSFRVSAPIFQNPFLGQMQMQQPINPIVGFQDESQPKFPDIPQFMQKAAGETFGGYGGLPSIKPIMQYAGMGDSPSAPPTMNKQRPLPRPPYNPDAQPGGPPPPKLIPRPLAKIMRSIFT